MNNKHTNNGLPDEHTDHPFVTGVRASMKIYRYQVSFFLSTKVELSGTLVEIFVAPSG